MSNSLSEYKKPTTVTVVQGQKYGEDYGYTYWWEIKTMDDKVYKINEEQKNKVLASAETAKFIHLGEDAIAVHQITSIEKKRSYFGPRESSNE